MWSSANGRCASRPRGAVLWLLVVSLVAGLGCRPAAPPSPRPSTSSAIPVTEASPPGETTSDSPSGESQPGETLSPQPAPPTAAARAPSESVRSVAPSVALGAYLPPVDQGRLEIAPPEQWVVLPRSRDYIARFSRVKSGQLPRILVTAQDAEPTLKEGPDGLKDLLESVKAETAEQSGWTERPATWMFAGRAAVMYVVAATADGVTVQRVLVETVLGPRRYRLELQTYPEFLENARQALYSVAAGMRAPVSDEGQAPKDKPAPKDEPVAKDDQSSSQGADAADAVDGQPIST